MILASFNLQVTLMLPTKFVVNWPLGSGEAKHRFSRWQPWQPSWISDQNDFSYFDLLVIPMLPIKFQDNWPFISGGETKYRFSRWRPSWISHQNYFGYFLSSSHPDASYQVSSQLAFRFRGRSKKIDFQDGGHGGNFQDGLHDGHLGFPIRMILATFDL